MRLSDLDDRRVVVWGAGREGASVLRTLRGRADLVLVVDAPSEADAALAAGHGAALATPDRLGELRVDAVVKSPGVPRYRAELLALDAAGVPISNPLAIFLAEAAATGHDAVGVTGTKGKSTTSTLVSALLAAAGRRTRLGGNIGIPVLNFLVDEWPDVDVVEVSSYQAADVDVSPRLGALTNLSPDHLTWHGGYERYVRDKRNLFTHGCEAVIIGPGVDPDGLPARPPAFRVEHTGVVRIADGVVVADTAASALAAPSATRNLAMALSVAELVHGPIPPEAVAGVVAGFTGLPSRQQVVATIAGRTFVDDALASNPASSAEILATYADRPVVLLVGGEDRTVAFDGLIERLRVHRPPVAVVLFSATGPRLAAQLTQAGVRHELLATEDVADALAASVALAPDDAVIAFSPAAPTPKAIGDWATRGARFQAAVRALADGNP